MNKKTVLISLAALAVTVLAFFIGVGAGAATEAPVNTANKTPVQYDPTPPQSAFLTYSAPAPVAPPAGTYTAGTYVVGSDIQPGTYKTTGPTKDQVWNSMCYWERMKNLDGGLDSIAANDNITGPGVLTVKPGDQGLKLSGSCTWVKQ